MSRKIKPYTSKKRSADAWVGANSTTRLSVDLPAELHAKFKSTVSSNKTNMSDVAIKLVHKYVEQYEERIT